MYLLKNGLPMIIPIKEWETVQTMLSIPRKYKKSSTKIKHQDSLYIPRVKSGPLRGFMVINPKWSKKYSGNFKKIK